MSRIAMAAVGCGAIFAALVAGCGEKVAGGPAGSPATSSAPITASSPADVTSTPPGTLTVPPATTTTAPPAAQSKECKAADLRVSLGAEEGTAGTLYRALVFTNTGGRTCTIQGFPGVSFVAGNDGHQVGRAAAWDGRKGPVVTLKPGAAAAAPLGFTNIDNYDVADCRPTPVRGLRVYAPHDTAAAFVPFPTRACAGTPPSNHLRVQTVHEGSGLG